VLTESEHEQLTALTLRRKTAQAAAMRARIVLACAEGKGKTIIDGKPYGPMIYTRCAGSLPQIAEIAEHRRYTGLGLLPEGNLYVRPRSSGRCDKGRAKQPWHAVSPGDGVQQAE